MLTYDPLRIDHKLHKWIITILFLFGCDVFDASWLEQSSYQDCGQTETSYATSTVTDVVPEIDGLEEVTTTMIQETPDANNLHDYKEPTPHQDENLDGATSDEKSFSPDSDVENGKNDLIILNFDAGLDASLYDANIDGDSIDGDNIDNDGDGDPDQTDCDPANPAIHRDAEETCDGVDNDCDGKTDDWCDTPPPPESDPGRNRPPPELNIALDCGVSVLHSDTGELSNWCDQPRPRMFTLLQPDGTWRLYLMCTNFYVAEGSRLQIEGESSVLIVASGVVTIVGRRKGDVRYIDSTTINGQPR